MKKPKFHPFVSPEAKEEYLKMYDEKAKEWPAPSESRMVDTPYGQTFVRINGPADAPPLVLLSGLGSNSLSWTSQVKTLSERFRTYAIDNVYNYGRSVHTRAIDSTGDLMGWLDGLFSALGLDRINLVGMSYGGWLAGRYALYRPDRLRKVVMLAPAATVLPLRKEIIERMIKDRNSPKDFIFWMFEDLVRKDEAGREAAKAMTEESIIAARCFNFVPHLSPTVMEDNELRSFKVPALFMVGENEKIYSALEAVARLNKVAPCIKTEVIPNAGHDFILVHTELVTRKILKFFERP